jgi:ppGpp synthetase/RelA/SpoT-type nucleotidyltranferase
MAGIKRESVNAAGKSVVQILNRPEITNEGWDDFDKAAAVINEWRTCHDVPLRALAINLRRISKRVDSSALLAQRTKRLISIAVKLNRFPKMKLTQMQGIGGCRAVLKSVQGVRRVDDFLVRTSGMKHTLAHRDDYIATPQTTGYRGIHLVYRYHSDDARHEAFNGLKIEMQVRSQYQHAWATAVETVGTFLGKALKSAYGPDEWLRFFALMGSVIAARERGPLVPGTPKYTEVIDELDDLCFRLNVESRLQGYANALRTMQQQAKEAYWYLLKLDPGASELVVTQFSSSDFQKAHASYLEAEKRVKENPGTDAVLVSVDSMATLPRAYPNYFADTRVFMELLKQALSGHQRKIFTGPLKLTKPDVPPKAGT